MVVFDCTGLLAVPLPAVTAGAEREPAPSPAAGKGALSVNAYLQVLAGGIVQPRMLCIGDCSQPPVPCGKLAYTAELQAAVAAENIFALHRGAADAALWSFPESLSSVLPAPVLLCCSLGAWDGVLVFNDIALTGWLAALMKLIIELSKVRQYREQAWAELMWSIAEPSVFAANRLYHAVKPQLTRWHTLAMHTPHAQ